MNIQIVKPQPGPQAAFIQCTADVVCYGGARGGGKSWAIALDFWLTLNGMAKLPGASSCARPVKT